MPETFDWTAVWALIVAGIALLVSVAAAYFTKIQADAAVGNVAPDFEMSGQRTKSSMARGIDVDVWNHNRQTIHITSFKFSAPKGVSILHQPTPGGVFSPPARVTRLKYEMAIKNIDKAKGVPTRFHFAQKPVPGQTPPDQYYVTCTVGYRVGGSFWPKWGRCALQFDK